MKVLQVAAEIFPLLKTGGLADVLGALPQALIKAGHDVRLVLPGMPAIADKVLKPKKLISIGPLFGAARVDLLLATMPDSGVPAYIVDAPYLYRRGGGPYQAADGSEWVDNLQRFGALGWVAAHLAAGELDTAWVPDIAHAHDWHAGMTCAYMAKHPGTLARSVYTVHNLAYQGLFAPSEYHLLGLPHRYMSPEGLEFHGQLSFMKAGLRYAHRVTTVSPTYAREIATQEFGVGLDGVIRSRGADVCGILNGVDPAVWDPSVDTAIATRYDSGTLDAKAQSKAALQRHFGIAEEPNAPIFTVVSRLTSQKGLDLVLGAMPSLLHQGAQFVIQGTGDPALEDAFRRAAAEHPSRVAVYIGYDESQAHRLIAGADVIMVPSRFEPCGLTQLYGLRYGTLPLVRRVGGLADTVVDAHEATLADGSATGFSFDHATTTSLEQACHRALALYRDPPRWRKVMKQAMAQDFSWDHAAVAYGALYAGLAK